MKTNPDIIQTQSQMSGLPQEACNLFCSNTLQELLVSETRQIQTTSDICIGEVLVCMSCRGVIENAGLFAYPWKSKRPRNSPRSLADRAFPVHLNRVSASEAEKSNSIRDDRDG